MGWVVQGFGNVEMDGSVEWMPHPARTQQPCARCIHQQTRMEEVLGFADSIRETFTGFRIFNVDSAILLGTMSNERSPVRGIPDAHRVFVNLGEIVAPIELPQNFAITKQEGLRSQALVNN